MSFEASVDAIELAKNIGARVGCGPSLKYE